MQEGRGELLRCKGVEADQDREAGERKREPDLQRGLVAELRLLGPLAHRPEANPHQCQAPAGLVLEQGFQVQDPR